MDKENIAIGIRLGNCCSCVAVYRHQRVEIIANEEGNKTTPSMVAFTPQGTIIGESAKNHFMLNAQNTVYDIEKLLGRIRSRDMLLWPFNVVAGKNDETLVEVEYKNFTRKFSGKEIISMVLGTMKQIAETYLNSKVKNAVIAVPAYFNDAQRRATKDAAAIAGLHVMQLIHEPVAAVIAYGLDTKTYSLTQGSNVLVFDLGGGTINISLFSIKKGVYKVLAARRDATGGRDFDNSLVDYCAQQFTEIHKEDIRKNTVALRRLRSACENAKKQLSTAMETVIEIQGLCEDRDFQTIITRTQFEHLNMELFEKCLTAFRSCLQDAKVKKEMVHKIVMVGGSTYIPKVTELTREFFGENKLSNTIHPDEAVAYGAAVQAAVINGERIGPSVIDVTPLSIGIATDGRRISVVVPKNTPIPTKKEAYCFLTRDNLTEVHFPVYQGERARAEDNIFLSDLKLSGLLAAPRRELYIGICFDIDGGGNLKVSAEHKTTGLKSEIIIKRENIGELSKEQMERMLVDAERFRLEDERFRKSVAARLAFEDYAYKMRNRVRKEMVRGLMEMEKVGDIEKGVKDAIAWANRRSSNEESDEFEKKLQELKTTCSAFTY